MRGGFKLTSCHWLPKLAQKAKLLHNWLRQTAGRHRSSGPAATRPSSPAIGNVPWSCFASGSRTFRPNMTPSPLPFSAREKSQRRRWPLSGVFSSSAWDSCIATVTRVNAWQRRTRPIRNRSALTLTYADFEQSDVLVFVGANPCLAHPIMWQRDARNPNKPEILVVDPRTTETAMAATQNYALRPSIFLLTGRGTSSQWHKYSKLEVGCVEKLYPKECYAEINPEDARRLQIRGNLDCCSHVSPRRNPSVGFCHSDGPTRAGLHSDALSRSQSVYVSGL